jgi:putative transposase
MHEQPGTKGGIPVEIGRAEIRWTTVESPAGSGFREPLDLYWLFSIISKRRTMKKSRFTEEHITAVLQEAEAGMKTPDICRKHGISEAAFHRWRANHGSCITRR